MEENLYALNSLLREHNVTGNVQYCSEFSDPRFKGYWYFNPASRGFLGKTFEEAYDALGVLIESVKSVSEPDSSQTETNWLEKIRKLLK
jgi:hypothetical protein